MQIAVGYPAAAPGPLRRGRLRDRLDRQPLHLRPPAVARDPRGARIDHVADAGHGQRRLGDVRGQHDAPAGVRFEHPLLLGGRQPGVQRQDLGVAEIELAQRVGGVADLPLAGQEHQHVAGRLALEFARSRRRSPRSGRASCDAVDDVVVGVVGIVGGRPAGRLPAPAGGSGSRPGRCGRTPRRSARRRSARANRSGSIVADVTITLRSGRRGSSRRR